jgi:hypothetical protein
MQSYTVYFIWKQLYMFRVIPPPIIKGANDCIYSIWYLSHRYHYLPLSWKRWNWFERAAGGVRLLSYQFSLLCSKDPFPQEEIIHIHTIFSWIKQNKNYIIYWMNSVCVEADSHIACRAHAVPLPYRAVNSDMPCRAPALLWQCRVLCESLRGSRKYRNC